MCGLTTFAGAATGFSGLYAVRVLGVDFTVILLCGLAGNAVRALFGPVFSAIAAKRGWKRCLGIQVVYGMLVGPLWALTNAENALYTYPIMILLTSVTGSGVRIGQLRLQIAASTQDSRCCPAQRPFWADCSARRSSILWKAASCRTRNTATFFCSSRCFPCCRCCPSTMSGWT